MANSDSFQVLRNDYPAGHPFQLQALTGSTTAEQLFLMGGAQTAVISVPAQTSIFGSFAPVDPASNNTFSIDQIGGIGDFRSLRGRPGFTSGLFDGRPFRVRAVGKFNNQANTTNAQTVTIHISQGTVVASTKVIATVTNGATNVASGPENFMLEATILWDSGLQYLTGEYWGAVNNSTTSSYATRALLANQINVTAYTGLQFNCSIIFATSSAASTANLVEFSMEAV